VRAQVVIGSNFGDEGKGLVTDWLTSLHPFPTTVVRFNGGSQAGHTVVTPDGKRHVFHHFGSGTLLGAPTYLSKYFITNPIRFLEEYNELMTYAPEVHCSPNALVTTPYDMLINQLVEEKRGEGRHGSCGCGINETVERNKIEPLRVYDLNNNVKLIRVLSKLRTPDYIKSRLFSNGVDSVIPEKYINYLENHTIFERFLEDCDTFLHRIHLRNEGYVDGDIVFEGAQGLLLDQDRSEYWPNVTTSKTGLDNVLAMCPEMGIEHLDIFYVTRWYVTRHGRGKLCYPLSSRPNDRVIDETNIDNKYQESLRYGILNLNHLHTTILEDLDRNNTIEHTSNLVITCMNQADDTIKCIDPNGNVVDITHKKLYEIVKPLFKNVYFSYGPSRITMQLGL
jgi:adenylosuccinate synthase